MVFARPDSPLGWTVAPPSFSIIVQKPHQVALDTDVNVSDILITIRLLSFKTDRLKLVNTF